VRLFNFVLSVTKRRSLVSGLWLVWFFHAATARATAPEPTLQCAASATGPVLLEVNCKLANTGGAPIFLLLDDVVLEGPVQSIPEYLYMPIAGHRYENVLQYHQKSMGSLEFGELFHPWVTLSLRKLARLALLEGGATRDITIDWPLAAGEYPRKGEWISRVKLLYLPQASANKLLRQGRLPPVCRLALSKGLKTARNLSLITLRARRPKGEREFVDDGCHDVISRQFGHLVSNTFEADLLN